MTFVVDDLAAWLVGALADAGVKKLTVLLFGTEQERALRDAATAAAEQSVRDLDLAGDDQQARRMAGDQEGPREAKPDCADGWAADAA